MRSMAGKTRGAARAAWWWLRQVTGDAAYENYLWSVAGAGSAERATTAQQPHRSVASPATVLSPEELFLDALRRKYARVSRCC